MKSGSEITLRGEALSIQDTRLEIIRGNIIENAKKLDSDKASIFHKKCDSAKSTLVLVKSSNGKDLEDLPLVIRKEIQ